ncbi:MAG: transposase [Acidimicrobiia bacterium]
MVRLKADNRYDIGGCIRLRPLGRDGLCLGIDRSVTGHRGRSGWFALSGSLTLALALLLHWKSVVRARDRRWRKTHYLAQVHLSGHFVKATNTVEGFFGQLKSSLDGTYHHVSRQHLQRYLNEFDYRYSTRRLTDAERTERAVRQSAGRRLAYKSPTVS